MTKLIEITLFLKFREIQHDSEVDYGKHAFPIFLPPDHNFFQSRLISSTVGVDRLPVFLDSSDECSLLAVCQKIKQCLSDFGKNCCRAKASVHIFPSSCWNNKVAAASM